MASETALHFRGDKNVNGTDTGHRKSRFTVVLCISAAGTVVKMLIIFKGLKKNLPKLKLPKNIDVQVSIGGSMDTRLMLHWIRSCFKNRGPFFAATPSALLMDSYGTHCKEVVKEALKKECGTIAVLIPPKTTSFLQPLDVSVNAPFKAGMCAQWNHWLVEGPQEYTQKGYRKRPSYQHVIDMVSLSLSDLKSESIRSSFRCCGVGERGEEIPKEDMNSRLRAYMDLLDEPKHRLRILQGLEEEREESDGDEEEDAEALGLLNEEGTMEVGEASSEDSEEEDEPEEEDAIEVD